MTAKAATTADAKIRRRERGGRVPRSLGGPLRRQLMVKPRPLLAGVERSWRTSWTLSWTSTCFLRVVCCQGWDGCWCGMLSRGP